MNTALSARQCAFLILRAVIQAQKTLDEAFFPVQSQLETLSDSDKQFVRLLVLTVLRRYGQIQTLLSPFLKKPLPPKLFDVSLVLSMGTAQLVFLKTPAHAAVDTSVRLIKARKKEGLARVVNGVLRTMERALPTLQIPPAVTNIPDWLRADWQRFTLSPLIHSGNTPHPTKNQQTEYSLDETPALISTQYSDAAATFADIFIQEPDLDLTVKENPTAWAEKWEGLVLPTGSVRIHAKNDITQREGYSAGDWWVQEASAAIPAQLFPDVNGLRVADLCAAPGGKTAQLVNRGAIVDAYDISEKRLNRLRENMKRLRYEERVHVICRNALEIQIPPTGLYDAVLLDAPCSATGTIRRHPDLLFHRTAADVTRLSQLQRALLQKAITLVKPGGYIVYATCSLQEAENEGVVQTVLAENKHIERIPVDAKWDAFRTQTGAVQVLPTHHQDGFYAALLRQKV